MPYNDYNDVYNSLKDICLGLDPAVDLKPKPKYADRNDVVYIISVLGLLVANGSSFTLENGSGTVANGSKVDLGGSVSRSTTINGTTDGTNRFPILFNAFSSFKALVNATAGGSSVTLSAFMTGSQARLQAFTSLITGEIEGFTASSTTGTLAYSRVTKRGFKYSASTDLESAEWDVDDLTIPSVKLIRDKLRTVFFSVFTKSISQVFTTTGSTYNLNTGIVNTDLVTNISEGTLSAKHISASSNKFLAPWDGRKYNIDVRVTLDITLTTGANIQGALKLKRVVDNTTVGQIFIINNIPGATSVISETFSTHVHSASDPFCVDGFYVEYEDRITGTHSYTITNVQIKLVSMY